MPDTSVGAKADRTIGTGAGVGGVTSDFQYPGTLYAYEAPTGPYHSRIAAAGFSVATAAAPTTATAPLPQVLYLQEACDSTLITINDIHQGGIGDCFLLSSIGEIALWHPNAIMNMIHANADGTETVTLYLDAATGQLPGFATTSLKATSVTVDNTYAVNSGATQDVVDGQKEIWVQVLEKAVATLGGGYSSITYGGYPMLAMEELTGQWATLASASALSLPQLQSSIAAGDLPSCGQAFLSISKGRHRCDPRPGHDGWPRCPSAGRPDGARQPRPASDKLLSQQSP